MAMTMMRAVDTSVSESESKRRMGLNLLVPLDYLMKGRSIPIVYLRVPNTDEAVSFYKAAFGAEVISPVLFTSLSITELTIDYGKVNVVLEECPDMGGIDDVAIRKKELYVEDVKAAFRRAVSAGAEVLDDVCKYQDDIHMEDVDMARVKDSFGCIWIFKSYPKRRGYFINLLFALFNRFLSCLMLKGRDSLILETWSDHSMSSIPMLHKKTRLTFHLSYMIWIVRALLSAKRSSKC